MRDKKGIAYIVSLNFGAGNSNRRTRFADRYLTARTHQNRHRRENHLTTQDRDTAPFQLKRGLKLSS